MADTPNIALPRLVGGQASGEITHNEALNKLDSLVMGGIKDRDLTTPPGGESNGDRYLVKAAGAGDWVGHSGDLAIYYDGWVFVTPKEGWRLWVDDENIQIVYTGAAWIPTIAFRRKEISENVNNSTAYQDDDDLFFTMGANDIWVCQALLIIQDASGGQAAGFKSKWTVPAGAELSGVYMLIDEGNNDIEKAGALADGAGTVLTMTNGNEHHATQRFTIVNGATPGDLQLEWAQNAAQVANLTLFGTANYFSHLYAFHAGYGVPLT